MGEYRRAGVALWFVAAAIALINVLMNLVLLSQLYSAGLWAAVTVMGLAQGIFSVMTPFATITPAELRWRIALARRQQTVPWSSIASWGVGGSGRRVELMLSDGTRIRVPLNGIHKQQRDSFLNEFRARLGAPSAG